MATSIQRETAKIYEFPTGGRAGRTSRLGGHLGMTNLEREMAELPDIVYGDSWYHDAAIAESDPASSH